MIKSWTCHACQFASAALHFEVQPVVLNIATRVYTFVSTNQGQINFGNVDVDCQEALVIRARGHVPR